MKRRAKSPSLTTIVRRALSGECALPAGTPLLVAVSGGPDSMALLSALARLAPSFGLALEAHGVDHGLRPEAGHELDLAETFATSIGVPFDRTRVVLTPGSNVQARARTLRWHALATAARRRGAAIATAHHADDRAETVLMRLLRGAGALGLGVLPPQAKAPGSHAEAAEAPLVVRPILRARRKDVLLHLERHGVPCATDPSNVDPRYLRTRVRRDVLPLLAELDPNVVRHLEALADELVSLRSLPPENAAARQRLPLPRSTLEALARMVASGSQDARVWLPGGLVVSVDPRAHAKRTGARAHVVPEKPGS